ncbi:unnamed protein product, partial [Sphacelaria rigidula]
MERINKWWGGSGAKPAKPAKPTTNTSVSATGDMSRHNSSTLAGNLSPTSAAAGDRDAASSVASLLDRGEFSAWTGISSDEFGQAASVIQKHWVE